MSAFIGRLLYKPFGRIFNLYLEFVRMAVGAAQKIIIGRQKIIRVRRFRCRQMQSVQRRDVPFVKSRRATLNARRERNVFGTCVEEQFDFLAPLVVRHLGKFVVNDVAAGELQFPGGGHFQNAQDSFGFEADTILRLIVVGTIQATDIEINSHGHR